MLSHLKGNVPQAVVISCSLLSPCSTDYNLSSRLILFNSCSFCFQQVFLTASQVFLTLKSALSLIWPFQSSQHWVFTVGQGLLVVARRLSLVAGCGLLSCCRAQVLRHGLSSCGVWTQPPSSLNQGQGQCQECGILAPRLGIELASPALGGGFLTIGPQGKSLNIT